MSDYSPPVNHDDERPAKRSKIEIDPVVEALIKHALRCIGVTRKNSDAQPPPYRTAEAMGGGVVNFTYTPQNGAKYTYSDVIVAVDGQNNQINIVWGEGEGDEPCIVLTVPAKVEYGENKQPIVRTDKMVKMNVDSFYHNRMKKHAIASHEDCIAKFRGENSKVEKAKTGEIGMAFVIAVALCFGCNRIDLTDDHKRDSEDERGDEDCTYYAKLAGFEKRKPDKKTNDECVLRNLKEKYSLENDIVQEIAQRMQRKIRVGEQRGIVKHTRGRFGGNKPAGGAGGASKY